MIETMGPLKRSLLHSPLQSQSTLRPKGSRARKTIIKSLLLTSLVDAFSILVIFLIMNNATSQEALNYSKLKLPQAAQTEIINQGIQVRIENGRFYVGEKQVALGQLAATLKAQASDQAQKDGVIIVADKKLDYSDLSPVIVAGSQAGFSKFKFAVIRKE